MAERVPLTKTLAKTLRGLREKAGLTQYSLAEQTGLTRPKIKRIENGEISTIDGSDYDVLMRVLGPTKQRKSKRDSNGTGPCKDAVVQEEVDRRIRDSVLTVMRTMMGDGVQSLMEQHSLQDVTLGELFGGNK